MPLDLAAVLVESGAISHEDLDRVLARQREVGGALDSAILELGLIPEQVLVPLLARAAGLAAGPAEHIEPDPRARRVFPARVAERHGLVPYRLDGRELSLLAIHPVDLAAVDEISFMLSLHLIPHVAPEWRVRELMARTYGGKLPERFAALAEGARRPPEPPAAAAPAVAPAAEAAEAAEAAPDAAIDLDLDFSIDEELPPDAAAGRDGEAGAPAPASPGRQPRASDGPLLPEEVPRWSREEAFAALDAARTRDEVVGVALRYTRSFLEAAAMFALARDQIIGRDALGWDGARARCRAVQVPLEQAGLFRAVVETGGPFLGPVATEPGNEAILAALGRPWPRTALVCPVSLHDRIVCILYADNGDAPVTPRRLGDLFLLIGALGSAFERILRDSKRGQADPASTAPGADHEERPASGEAPPAPLPGPSASVDELVTHLSATRHGSPERERLVADLVLRGPEAAAALRAAFPGPLDAAEDAASLPPEQRGPVLAGLAGLGVVATPFLVDLLADADAGRRRWAALLLGRVRDPAGFLPLAERVLDRDAGVGEAALASLSSVRQHPDFQPVLERLRRALLGCDADRPAQAARALARLGDAGAIPLLIQALGAPEPLGGAAAAALEALTCRRFGREAPRWISWWKDHRTQRRADWLFAALEDEDGEVRLAAAEALREAAPAP